MIKFPPPRDCKGVKFPGYARGGGGGGGGMLKLRFDRYKSVRHATSEVVICAMLLLFGRQCQLRRIHNSRGIQLLFSVKYLFGEVNIA